MEPVAEIAVVVAETGQTLDPDALREYALANLSSYKAPFRTYVMQSDAIPRTASSKPNKPELARIVSSLVDW